MLISLFHFKFWLLYNKTKKKNKKKKWKRVFQKGKRERETCGTGVLCWLRFKTILPLGLRSRLSKSGSYVRSWEIGELLIVESDCES